MDSLIVHRASRTERLADELIDSLHRDRPENPLAPQTIVIPHAGMRRWLLQTIASRPVGGKPGIAANFDTVLPWQWLQRTAKTVLGDEALVAGDYNTDSLRWHLYRALQSSRFVEIENYAGGEDSERRRFQLAARLADVFTQYLVYRPEMILAWERGNEPKDWQAELWRTVRKHIGKPHRAERKELLAAALGKNGDGESLPLHVFGVSHLPPDVLECLRAVAPHRSIHVYFPDPCREHWDYLRKNRSVLATADAESLYFEVGHPLLASLGRVGQDFSLALDDAGEHRDALDEGDAPETASNLLDALQTSIRVLQPDYVRDASQPSSRDTSLRVHACHTRLRELEVLKDQLLGLLADDAMLQPRDIVVMAPDIAAYAPFLPSVFGEPARYSDRAAEIPWHIADVAQSRTHPLFDGFSKLLDISESRFRVSDVIDFEDVPAVARRFGFDAQSRAHIEPWLRRAHVSWGLDAAMKEQAGAASLDANTWSFGFDRLYAGFVVGNEPQSIDAIVPVAGVAGSGVDALGRMDRLIDTLRRFRNGTAIERTLGAWSVWLRDAVDATFAVDNRDDKEEDAMDALRRIISGVAQQADAAGANTTVPWSIARDVVRGALETIPERQPFLLGGVTFCGLVPQRSIPFRVVALLGMNAGEYPRVASDSGLNRMLSQPRRGDRDTRNEDRYLFLEAIMAARQALHISFIGEDVAEGGLCNPASPLAELLEFLDEQFGVAADADDTQRPWLIRHPLQPFDQRYFDRSDARLFSFQDAYAKRPQRFTERNPFVDIGGHVASPVADAADISLKSLTLFWRDSAKATLRDALGIGLDALDTDATQDVEPMSTSLDRRDALEERLWRDAYREERDVPESAPSWLADSGAMAAGELGARAYALVRMRAQAMLAAVRDRIGWKAPEHKQAVDLTLDGERLVGTIERVVMGANGTPCLLHTRANGHAHFGHVLPFYVKWALLRLLHGDAVSALFLECDGKTGRVTQPGLCEKIVAQSVAQLRGGLLELIRMMRQSTSAPTFLFPKTSWKWVTTTGDDRDAKAQAEWRGGFRMKGESNYEPSYAALLARGSRFPASDSRGFAEFVRTNEWIVSILDPHIASSQASGGEA
jgi:exodeoxyribonuclease V gamma subunit